MIRFLLRRISFLLLTLFLVSIAVFLISELAPGDLARNSLGHQITPEQAQSFNAQWGLDQPLTVRYVRWMIGSDWQAEQKIGNPVRSVYEEENDRYIWYAVDEDGNLYQNYTSDGETMYKVIRQPDGSVREVELPDDVWQQNEEGFLVYWGVDQQGRAAMWVKGEMLEAWVVQKVSWNTVKGAPRRYIPLQRGLLRGDPGFSLFTRLPVAVTLKRRLRNTAILAGIAFAFIMPLALLLGVIAGLNEGKFIDRVLSVSSLIATATPEFASGLFLILIFSIWLGLVPGAVVLSSDTALFENPEMLILPVLTLTLVEVGYVLRITRASMVEVLQQNYIRTAVMKGLPRWKIVMRHALRNALIAPITVIMLHVNWLVGGIVVVESLFGFPGVGRYIYDAAVFKDVFAVEAAAMTLVIIAVVTQLFADIIYTFLNPRIRFD
jgi:peptide/nickel transport system permease protein